MLEKKREKQSKTPVKGKSRRETESEQVPLSERKNKSWLAIQYHMLRNVLFTLVFVGI